MDRDRGGVSGDDDDTECRICRGGAEIGPLLHPCKCAGSIRYVHQECLDAWLSRTNSVSCELCHQPFVFSPVYAPNAPEILSAPEFVIGVVNIGAKKLVLVFRVVRALVICFWSIILMAVIFLWILCLPVGTSWICRLYFLRSLNGLFRFRQRLQLGALVSDWMQGLLLSLLVVTVFLAVSGLREYMLRQERQQQQQQENNQNPNNAQDQADANPDVIPRRRQNDDAVEEVAMGNWGDDELPVDLEDFSAALPRAGTMHDEVTEVEGVAEDQFGEEDLGEVYNVDAVDQDLLRQRHLLQLQQRLRQQQALLAEAREQQREAEAVRAAARDEARAMAAAAEEEEEQRRQLEMHADNDDMMLGFLDVREEEVPLEEFVGLHGPIRVMFENVLTALISNALSIGSLTLMPFTIGRLVLWLKHNWHLVLAGRIAVGGMGGGKGAGAGAHYSDWVTLVIGYAALLLLTLKVLLVSLLLGQRQKNILIRQVLTALRYLWILCKVGVLLMVELVAFPMGCGWWLDFCSLDVLGATYVERIAFFRKHLLVSHFVHWALGVAFMIHVAVLVAVLREVVRPEVLWFLRNPEEAIEHPLRDLIDEPIPKHARRITLCLILYLPLTLVLVYLPVTAAKMLAPVDVFPIYVSLDTTSHVPPEVLLLHVSLPLIMEHCRPRHSFKQMLHCWIEIVGTWLGLRDSLLPAREEDSTFFIPAPPAPHTNGSAGYVADDEGPDSPSEYSEGVRGVWGRRVVPPRRNSVFARGISMLALAGLSIALLGAAVILSSLTVGRGLLRALVAVRVKHDVYAFGIGFCICSTCVEMTSRLHSRLQTQQAGVVLRALAARLEQLAKAGVAVVVLGGVVAGMLGVLLDLVLIVPFRVPLHQSPELFGVEQWMGGLLLLKFGCRILVDTPSLAPLAPLLRHRLLDMYQRGWQNIHLVELLDKVALPMIAHLSLLLCVPYLIAWGALARIGMSEIDCLCFWRWSYPAAAAAAFALQLLQSTGRALSQVHDTLRDSLYLVGRRLHNLPVPT